MKFHYTSTVRSWICKEYSPPESSFYQLKTVPYSTRLESGSSELAFTSSSPLTTKHCDRHLLTVASIIDLFICLEACCRVTSSNENRNYRCSKVVTYKLTTVRQTEFRRVFWYVQCVKFSVPLTIATVCETVARKSEWT